MSVFFTCRIEGDGSDFAENPREALIDILEIMIGKIKRDSDGGKLFDSNGNSVGRFDVSAEVEEDDYASGAGDESW